MFVALGIPVGLSLELTRWAERCGCLEVSCFDGVGLAVEGSLDFGERGHSEFINCKRVQPLGCLGRELDDPGLYLFVSLVFPNA